MVISASLDNLGLNDFCETVEIIRALNQVELHSVLVPIGEKMQWI